MTDNQQRFEEFKLNGAEVVDKVKDLIHQGNIRRITIKNEKGVSLMEIPLTLGILGAALLPVLAALGAMAAIVTRMSLVVERIDGPDGARPEPGNEDHNHHMYLP